jgi:hypothetical protein
MGKKTAAVCYVDENGTLICDSRVDTADGKLKTAVKTMLPGASNPKVDLIARLVAAIQNAPIDDDCIDLRADDIVGAVNVMLAKPDPVMLLFRYVALPGNILAAYYVQQNEFPAAHGALDHWSTLKPGC